MYINNLFFSSGTFVIILLLHFEKNLHRMEKYGMRKWKNSCGLPNLLLRLLLLKEM